MPNNWFVCHEPRQIENTKAQTAKISFRASEADGITMGIFASALVRVPGDYIPVRPREGKN